MAYMAPEVVGRKGYSWPVDWWGLGVVAWELLFHRRPFDGRTAEKMTQSILKDPLKFPKNANEVCSSECQDFVRGVSRATLEFIMMLIDVDVSASRSQYKDAPRLPQPRAGYR